MTIQPPITGSPPSSQAVFLVLRRMRGPLIVLVVIFSVSVLGLTLIPGDSVDGAWHMGFFDAFYFMSYTASTIGYGEIPQAFNDAQRMWVTLSIYLTVIGWAYAIGSLLALLQGRAFRDALALQRFRRKVARLREPFWLMAGHGQTGELLGRWLDELGLRFVVVDVAEERIDVLELGSYVADVPAITADARNPQVLAEAGLRNPHCAGVLAITDDDEANLAVTMAATVLRPDLPVIARSSTPAISQRMAAFGTPTIINPFDRFGDHFTVAIRAPATEQLTDWLTSAPGAPLPARTTVLPPGRWIVCGYGRFGQQIASDLRRDLLEVFVVEAAAPVGDQVPEVTAAHVIGDGTEPAVLELAGVNHAVGFVAGTDNDFTNLSLVTTARRVNPGLFIVARQNQPVNAALFAATGVDLLMVPSKVVAQEALAHIGTPLLWRFLQEAIQQDEAWSAELLARLVGRVGEGSPELWRVEMTADDAPAVARRIESGPFRVGDLLRDPQDRAVPLDVVTLMVLRDEASWLAPEDDFELRAGDRLLLAGRSAARRAMESTLEVDASAAYVLTGDATSSSWVWQQIAERRG